MSNRPQRISRALAIIVCACTIPALLALVVGIGYSYSRARQDLLASSVRRAVSVSAAVDSLVKGLEIGVATLSASPYLASGNLRRFHEQARSVLPHVEGAHNFYLVGTDGRLLVDTATPFGDAVPISATPELVRRVLENGKPQLSNLIRDVTGQAMVALAVPVIQGDSARYVLVAAMRPQEMSKLLARQPLPKHWVVSVYDREYRFISRSRDIARFLGRPAAVDLHRAMVGQVPGTTEGYSLEGTRVLAAFTRSPSSGWSVSVAIPKAVLLKELNLTILGAIAAAGLIAGPGVIAAAITAARIRAAIVALIPPAEALSRSDPVELPVQLFAETRLVALALQRTSDKLRRSEHEARHDPLTGLPNRSFLNLALPHLIGDTLRSRECLALLYIDLDGFKLINDTLGHKAGDEVLCSAAARASALIRLADVCVRLGGDEFAVVLLHTGRQGALTIADKLVSELSRPIDTSQGPAAISASIGIALVPDDADEAHLLVLKADTAMYQAKRAGKGRAMLAGGDGPGGSGAA
jgi:diguanylate cyclase (GGDEF)-like protein